MKLKPAAEKMGKIIKPKLGVAWFDFSVGCSMMGFA